MFAVDTCEKLRREVTSMNARLKEIEEQLAGQQFIAALINPLKDVDPKDLADFVAVFKDAAGGLRTIARVANWAKNFTIFGISTGGLVWQAGGLRTIARVANWAKNFTIFGISTGGLVWLYNKIMH